MSVFRLVVRSAQGDVSQGTCWIVAPQRVCTAFHVVGHCAERSWMHQLVKGASYWLETGNGPLALAPLVFDADADVALLEGAGGLPAPALPLAEAARTNVPWRAQGYPAFHAADAFVVSGRIVALRDDDGSRGLQLTLEQGAQIEWGGISGAAIVDDKQGRVVGVVTQVTEGADTAWGAKVESVQALIALDALAGRAAQIEHAAAPPAHNAWRGLDRKRLAEGIDRLARTRPGDPEVSALQAALARTAATSAMPLDPEALARLRDQYDVIAVREGGRIIRPVAAQEFADVLAAAKRFGGRRHELARLGRFVLHPPSGYFFVTGGAGFGKTSLLAYWIDTLRRRGDTVCFHFFTGRVEESLDPEHTFRRLAEQLLAAHGLGGDLPRDRVRLQSLYVDLLRLPAPRGGPLVVILDGLDEGLETIRPGPAMFPHELGDGVFIVFSARKTAGYDWLQKLELSLEPASQIDLGALGRDDLAEIVVRAGLAASDALLDVLQQKTAGDPFYVDDVLRALVAAKGDGAVLDTLPATHSAYLERWWKDAVRRVARPGFVDLMGTLTALRAPLGARDLVTISKDDPLSSATIGVLLEDVSRYVDSDRDDRYWLRHGRIRQFVRETLGGDMATYDERVLGFALRWNDPKASADARAYGRRHVIAHLLAADRFGDALALLDPDFIAARWREDGSYVPLIGDLDQMLAWLVEHRDAREPVCHALALAVMRESARDLIRNLPEPLWAAWVRLEGYGRVKEMLDSLPSYRGEARDPLLAVAAEMIDLGHEAKGGGDADVALELLARTIGLLALVRTDLWTFEAYDKVCALLQSGPFTPEQAQPLLRQAWAFASQIDATRPELEASCLARLAGAALPWDREMAARLVADWEALMAALPLGDQAFALAQALPALRQLTPGTVAERVTGVFEALAWQPQQAALAQSPLRGLLEAWAPDPAAHDAVDALMAANEQDRPWRAGRVRYEFDPRELEPALLLRLGFEERAWNKVQHEIDAQAPSLNVLLAAWKDVPAWRARLAPVFAALPLDGVGNEGLERALAHAGRWADLGALIARSEGRDLADTLPLCIEAVLAHPSAPARDEAVALLREQLARVAPDDAPACSGAIALALARAEHADAHAALAAGLRYALSNLPEGDTDSARQLVAIELACTGAVEAARDVAAASQWWHDRLRALLATVANLPADDPARADILQQVAAILRAPVDTTFLADAVGAACDAARGLASRWADALLLLDATFDGVRGMGGLDVTERIELTARLLDTYLETDPGQAAARAAGMDAWIKRLTKGGLRDDEPDGSFLEGLFALTGAVIATEAAAARLFDEVLDWMRGLPLDPDDRVAALAAAAAAAARFDPARGAALFGDAVQALDAFKDARAAAGGEALFVSKMFDDLLRRRSKPWLTAVGSLLKHTCAVAGLLGADEAVALLEEIWARAWALAGSAQDRHAAALALFDKLPALAAAQATTAVALAGRIAADLAAVRGELDVDEVLETGIGNFAAVAHFDAARLLGGQIADDTRRAGAEEVVEVHAWVRALPDPTPVEQALQASTTDKKLAASMVHFLREGSLDDILAQLVDILKDTRVRYQLLEWAPHLAATIMKRWDAQAGKAVVDAVADADARLIAAAARVHA